MKETISAKDFLINKMNDKENKDLTPTTNMQMLNRVMKRIRKLFLRIRTDNS